MTDEQTWLRKRPSTKRWRLEIERIMAGQRDAAIQRIGGVQEYVDRCIFDSDDPSKAGVDFREALRQFVQSWKPADTAVNGIYFTSTLLELIGAYTPPNGFGKILAHLQNCGYFAPRKWQIAEKAKIDNLALMVLQRYYEIPPPDSANDPAFQKYDRFLHSLLQVSGNEGHALRRLLELGLIDTGSDLVAELIGRPHVVSEIIQYAFSMQRADLMKCAGYILGCCLKLDGAAAGSAEPQYDHYHEFKASLGTCGAVLVHGAQAPSVRLADGKVIELWLRPGAEYYYMEMRERDFRTAGNAKWAKIDDEAI